MSSSTADAAATRNVVIPPAFRGEWNLRLEDCGGSLNDSRLIVGDRALEFYESSGEVISAAAQGHTLTVTASMSGEGETWEETYRFRLSPDRQALLQFAPESTEGLRRLRCPERSSP